MTGAPGRQQGNPWLLGVDTLAADLRREIAAKPRNYDRIAYLSAVLAGVVTIVGFAAVGLGFLVAEVAW